MTGTYTTTEACGCKLKTTTEHVYELGQHGYDLITCQRVPCELHGKQRILLSGTVDDWVGH